MTASRLLRITRQRLRALLHPQALDAELDREMAFHLERLAEEKQAEGLSPEAALREARRAFGNPAALVERTREARGLGVRADGVDVAAEHGAPQHERRDHDDGHEHPQQVREAEEVAVGDACRTLPARVGPCSRR